MEWITGSLPTKYRNSPHIWRSPNPLYLPPMGPITRKPRPAIPMEVRPATLTEVKEDNTVDNTADSNTVGSNMVDNT